MKELALFPRFFLDLAAGEKGVVDRTLQPALDPGDGGSQFPVGYLADDHQIQIAGSVGIAAGVGTVEEGQFDAGDLFQGGSEFRAGSCSFEEEVAEVIQNRRVLPQRVVFLVAHRLGGQETRFLQAPQLPRHGPCGLLHFPGQPAHVERQPRVEEKISQELDAELGGKQVFQG
ncbi:MAG: hypothetical protein A2V67_07670 [Deltaproteobacteria bacterium RBG_13_61_14]|nr:MAG: hypothetical protein A2V67_07670 [Deltaproteobacteria bacterium RBG_13_61_14]